MLFNRKKNNKDEKELIKEIKEYDRMLMKRFLEEQQNEQPLELTPEGRESLKKALMKCINGAEK